MISLLAIIPTVLGCGVMPAGQVYEYSLRQLRDLVAASNRTFTVTGFSLPIAMVYSSTAGIQSPGIASSEAGARGFVQRLVMQTVFDVLERQGRSALLPDAVISAILGQLTVEVTYNPLNCPMVTKPEVMHNAQRMTEIYCIVVDNTVTGICTVMMGQNKPCNMHEAPNVMITAINGSHLTISGTLSTTNIVMANWSRQMWQSVVNRALRMMALGPFRSALLLGRCYCRGKLILNCDIFEINIHL
ncbi:hypothetical protein KIN20_026498 [Parelaphostrongylus tenuis]|uniref:Uncharacterized protein n=1 Tax=Parelaphostrongylus tenuis TaxID=148309 RepID=A0AAD5WCV5_PARTN|nr:hypothetical protein KIN20_026498 [Parelaphostrongylus tenuis]